MKLIDSGEAALLLIGGNTLEAAIDKLQLKAEKHVAKQLDVSTKRHRRRHQRRRARDQLTRSRATR